DLMMITTRHDLHASMVIESLKAGKNVFVEKPLCLTADELEKIILAADERRWTQMEGGPLSLRRSICVHLRPSASKIITGNSLIFTNPPCST
ncbi:Gfo/Idh/MocA family oxidoreductase, partial [candidate division WOR-3 bacterium]|nr:Gfo/Idh/MocA family oxidoreductase [candidate division WOR-3 bacterium]